MFDKINALKKIAFKALLLVIPLYVLWFLYIRYMPIYYNRPNELHWFFIKKSLEKEYRIPETDILFLGESRVNAGIDFTEIEGSYSFAAGGATPVEMYYILKKYSENYPLPDTVFMSISPRFLSETYAFFPYAVAQKLINQSDFKDIISHSNKHDTILGKNPELKFFLYQLNYFEYYQSNVLYNYVFKGYKSNTRLIDYMILNKGASLHPGLKDSCSELNYETNYLSFKPAPLLTAYFEKILIFCKRNDIFLIFDFMPFNESSFNVMNKNFISEYKTYINAFARQYPELIISDTLYCYPDIFFGDESHLNAKGKEKFTEYLNLKYFNKKLSN